MTDFTIHPVAALFPMMTDEELKSLANDIKKNGLREKITYRLVEGVPQILDGRNRMQALELAGYWEPGSGFFPTTSFNQVEMTDAEATAFIISKNLERRHLTTDQKRDFILALLKVDPSPSNADRRAWLSTIHASRE